MTRGERFTPFLAFPPELRRVIYTTNSIESLNHQLRKITQEPRPLPKRSRGRQAALAGDLRHRRQIERATGRKSEVCAPSNAKHPDASSRARPRRTGNKHCNNSHWSTPTASTPTSDHHDRERLHKELDRLWGQVNHPGQLFRAPPASFTSLGRDMMPDVLVHA